MGVLNALKRVIANQKPLSTDVNQLIDGLSGNSDVGPLSLFAPIANPSAPTVAINTTAGILTGNYQYILVNVTGWVGSDGSFYVRGFAPSVASATVAPSGQQVNVTWSAGPSGTIAQFLCRTTAGGTQFKFVQWFANNTTTAWTDNVTDANLGTGMPTVNGTAIPANVPTYNSTGSYLTGSSLSGVNALAHSTALNALLHFENTVDTTRGIRGTFTRSSSANNPYTLLALGNNVPGYGPGKFGQAISVWEGTTNLVENSDFETFTTTATVFSDPLTSYSGSSAAPWTVQGGSFTFGSGGATSGANGSVITAGNSAWKPLLGSDGSSNLLLNTQATFTQPATVGLIKLLLYIDSNNSYQVYVGGGNIVLVKTVGGTVTNLYFVAQTLTASSTYTMTLSLDHSGNLTAKLYSGSGTGGTLLQTLTATDTSLTGGFLLGVGGDTGVIISNASVTAPWANGWAIGGDARVAWALTTQAINGTYSMSGKGVASGVQGYASSGLSLAASTAYTVSGYMSTSGVGSGGARVFANTLGTTINTPFVSGTTANQRYTASGTSGTTGAGNVVVLITDVGTAVFDCLQVEAKSYATPYLRNNSTSASAARSVETLTLPSSLLSASAGTVAAWMYFTTPAGSGPYNPLFTTAGGVNPGPRLMVMRDKTNGKLSVYDGDGTTEADYTSMSVLSPNTWYHVVFTWSNQGRAIYINGTQETTNARTQPIAVPNSTFYVGGDIWWGQVDGLIDELQIFNRALLPSEVYSLFAATQPLIDALPSQIAPDTTTYNQSSTSPDANDVYTTVTYTRQDGTTYMVSALSGSPPVGTSQYPTMTWTYYDATGLIVTRTQTFSLTYDASGKRTAATMTN